jgi:hypothetical protein
MGPPRVLAMVALAALITACTTSSAPPATSPLPSPSPILAIASDSRAADLRIRLDLLLGEHVFLIAKEADAAAGPRTDEYTSYLGLLTSNGTNLSDLVSSAFGDTAASQFDQLWSAHNGFFVDYTVGLAAHNQDKASGAITSLTKTFVPQLSQFIATQSQLPLDPMTLLANEQVLETKAVIDDAAAQDATKLYADLRTAYAQSSRIGDAIANQIAVKFPDRFPGDTSIKGFTLRLGLNQALLEHAYLATMATNAAVGGRAAERAAAVKALADNADRLGTLVSQFFGAPAATQLDGVMAAKDAALIAYAVATETAGKQAAQNALLQTFVDQFSGLVDGLTGTSDNSLSTATLAQVQATVTVIDDEQTKAFAQMGPDDRAAALAVQSVADHITDAAVTKMPALSSA